MPKGYIVAALNLHSPGDAWDGYRARVSATIAAHGGRYLTRGGETVVLEGGAPAPRMVVLEFDSPEQAMTWYNSPEYQAVLPLRLQSADGPVVCVAGV